jgi:hypothetical protein
MALLYKFTVIIQVSVMVEDFEMIQCVVDFMLQV